LKDGANDPCREDEEEPKDPAKGACGTEKAGATGGPAPTLSGVENWADFDAWSKACDREFWRFNEGSTDCCTPKGGDCLRGDKGASNDPAIGACATGGPAPTLLGMENCADFDA